MIARIVRFAGRNSDEGLNIHLPITPGFEPAV